MTKEEILQDYKDAYRTYHGEDCKIIQRGSWLYINDTRYTAYRLSQLPAMAKRLREMATERTREMAKEEK